MEMEIDKEIDRDTKKDVESVGNKAITKKIIPTYLYLPLLIRKISVFMYFIYNVMYSNIN